MPDTTADDWSPADNPYAIAVSQAQWWQNAARLAIWRMRRDDDTGVGWVSSRQVDAANLILALVQLLRAERLEQAALDSLNIDRSVSEALSHAAKRFTDRLQGIEDMRDGLTHFDEWSRGLGRGPQKTRRDAGRTARDVAREYWRFGYDPGTGTVSFGPYTIEVDAVDEAARELFLAIYEAARSVDEKHTAELRARTVSALTTGGIPCDMEGSAVSLSQGQDLRIWVSLGGEDRGDVARRVVEALAHAGLRLVSVGDSQAHDQAARLGRGESLYVEREA
jgi:hypothetical protein